MLLNSLLMLMLLFLLAVFLLLPGNSSPHKRAPFWGLYIAHRGLHSRDQTVPENSLQAFAAAVEEGYGIEIDIQLTADGEVVVFHDETLLRATGLDSAVAKTDWQTMHKLTLFNSSQRVPLLSETLQCVGGAVPLVVEFKPSGNYKKLCRNAWRVLRRYDGDLCVQSFDPRVVRWFKKKVPGVLRGQLSAPPSHLKKGLRGWLVGTLFTNFYGRPQFIAYKNAKKPFTVRLAQQFAMRFTWTVRSDDAITLVEKQNDAVIFEYFNPAPRYKNLAPTMMERYADSRDGAPDADEVFINPDANFKSELDTRQNHDKLAERQNDDE